MAIQISGTTVIDDSRNITNAGTGSFSGTVSVATPTASNHIATKSYVDSSSGEGNFVAWCYGNTITSNSVIASGNVSSLTDEGVGKFVANFTSAVPSANYAITGTASDRQSEGNFLAVNQGYTPWNTRTTSAISFNIWSYVGSRIDAEFGFAAIY